MNNVIIAFVILLFSMSWLPVRAQTMTGTWRTVDDRDKQSKSYVRIYEETGLLFGKITKLLKDKPDAICEVCKGPRKNQALLGMVVIEGLRKIRDQYGDGRIYDPVTGNDYKCTIWIEAGKPDELKVRGTHWSGIYRTQTWYKVTD
ncbi:MAG TPA: DUF2147 domain-containing protein [Saprospiraceae bacterium]|nr:DUF2147 domain-containing protein [Saprospiraceae bacterium]HNT20389.1 DUF2147 domain-containing protein [Saprospiraceae bacterium]